MSDVINGVMNSGELPQPCTCSGCQKIGASGMENEAPVQDDPLYNPTVTATPEQFASYLTHGFWEDRNSRSRQWDTSSDNEITFSINSNYSAAQQDGIRMAFDMWADVADVTFREISANADIDIITNTQGRAFSSSSVYVSSGNIASNYISIDTSEWFWQNFDQLGDYAMLTMIHEIGHSLGLGHTANYNGSGTYASDAQFVNDSHQYSVMSYFNASNTGSNHQGEYASTAMLYDIVAIQSIYGANTTTRAGDTIYGFNTNTGLDQFDFTVNTRPVISIWDTGGTDTIDASGFSQNQIIRLTAGEFSNIGGSTGNVSIAYGAEIENAIGGSGNDWLFGNDGINNLNAFTGNDRVYGSLGNDTLSGGAGTDTLYYENDDLSDFTITIVNPTTLQFTHNIHGYTDIASDFELYNIGGTTYSHSYLNSLLSVNYIELAFGGENNSWRYELGNAVAGSFTVDSGDAGLGGTTTYVTGDRTSNNTITVSNSGGNSEFATISSGVITNFTTTNFEWMEAYLQSSNNITVNMTGVQRGRLLTNIGDDNITVSASLVDAGDARVFGIQSDAGNDTIVYNGGDASLSTDISGGAGNDDITVTGLSRSVINGGDGDDTIEGGNGFDEIRGGFGNDDIRGRNDNDRIYGDDGEDILNGDNGADQLWGGEGNDTINGGNDNDRLHGENGDDTIRGGNGDDRVWAGAGNDIIDGDADNDLIYGEDGDDEIDGGLGDDTINGGAGNDTIDGGEGNDRLFAKDDNDTVRGGAGNDTIYGENGIDTLYGDDGEDFINGGFGNDTLYGGIDADELQGGGGDDILHGEDGNDILRGGNENDTLHGGNNDDTLYGDEGNDTINGDAGSDTLYGGNGNDTMRGGSDTDYLYAASGTDFLYGDAGDDFLYGSTGDDTLYGGDGVDRLFGQDDNDTIYGGAGADRLEGGNGNDFLNGDVGDADTLYGGNGNDTLIGHGERDFLYGQGGADVFATVEYNGRNDRYYTFDLDTGDTINVTDILSTSTYVHGISDIDDYVYFTDFGSVTGLYVDTNGGASGDFVAAIYSNDLDGFTASSLMAQGDLIANQTVL